MEPFAYLFIALIIAPICYGAVKIVKFFMSDTSASRYTYENVEVDGEIIEVVKDNHDTEQQ
jgi:hypothetical protein